MSHLLKSSKAFIVAVASIATMTLSSCGVVFDDLEPCRGGAEMRFVYDYNLESANAFASQVDCLTLHIYDANGSYVTTVTETSSVLADESWRMTIDLDPGNYHAIAYGGIACENASFAHQNQPQKGSSYNSISMGLLPEKVGKRLHDHFHGAVDFTISDNALDYTPVTMRMTKTTNHLRIILQQIDGAPVDGNDFEFSIIDNNAVLDHNNIPVAEDYTIYPAWQRGQLSTASANNAPARGEEADAEPVLVGFGDLSTSRLYLGNNPKLVIYSKEHQQNIVELPLNSYLVMSNDGIEGWSSQEYLDRCSRWSLTFFLDRNNFWATTRIIVNGWSVRINDINQ